MTEYVNGIVIGELSRPYRFYTLAGICITKDAQWFRDDSAAIDWWYTNCQRYGFTMHDRVEMRAYVI